MRTPPYLKKTVTYQNNKQGTTVNNTNKKGSNSSNTDSFTESSDDDDISAKSENLKRPIQPESKDVIKKKEL